MSDIGITFIVIAWVFIALMIVFHTGLFAGLAVGFAVAGLLATVLE